MVCLLGGSDLNYKETELCLGLPGGGGAAEVEAPRATGKRGFSETVVDLELNFQAKDGLSVVDLKEAMKSKEKTLLAGASPAKDPAKPPAK